MKYYKGITARGNSIQVSFTWNGDRYRETLRWTPTAPNMREANRLRESVLYEIDRGTFDHSLYASKFPNSLRAQKLASTKADFLTIDQALWSWLRNQREHLQMSTIRDYTSAIKHHLSPQFGLMVVSELTHQYVKEWLMELRISNKRKNNIIIPLRRCFEELYLDEVIDRNPMLRVKNLSVSAREPNPFTDEEVQAILSQLDTPETQIQRNLIQFAFGSGLRTSELIALTWCDVDLERNRINVSKARVRGVLKGPKTKSGIRIVDLTPLAREAIERQQQYRISSVNEVFYRLDKFELFNDQCIRKSIWKPALKRAGLTYRNPYQTRHTYASKQLINGKNPLYVANQMGHTDWGMIRKIYGRWINQTK